MRNVCKILAIYAASLISSAMLTGCRQAQPESGPKVRIAVAHKEHPESGLDSYYEAWLEEKSGLEIEFVPIPESYTYEYLRLLLSGESNGIDAVFFTEDYYMTPETLEFYGDKGMLMPLEPYIERKNSEIATIIEQFDRFDLHRAMEDARGHIYYMPALDTSRMLAHSQVLWMNLEWLEEQKLPFPRDTDSFREVLRQFSQAYPEGVPLLGSMETSGTSVIYFLMNAFTVCDPANGYMAVENGTVFFAPLTDRWREGLSYCHDLYTEGLLPDEVFTFSKDQLSGMVNDSRNLVGCFCAKSISDVLSEQSSDVLNRYLVLPPLNSREQRGISVPETKLPRPGGVILSGSAYGEEIFSLMDLMCTEEAYLAGHYGEQGKDWNFAAPSDISAFGEPAVITIRNQEWYQKSGRVSGTMGPYVVREKYADGISWVGYQINQSAYMNARAYKLYKSYQPPEYLTAVLFRGQDAYLENYIMDVVNYTKDCMKDFITGARDIHDDAVWEAYCKGFDTMQIEALMQAAVKAGWNTGENE